MPTAPDRTLEQALAFLDRTPLVDGHNDLPWVVRESPAAGDIALYDLAREHPETDTDIPRLKAGKVGAQFWAAFVPTRMRQPARVTFEQIDLIHRMNALYPEVFLPATRASDIAEAKRQGRIASFVAVESGVGLENSLALLRSFYGLGVRYMTLCHYETLDWVDSATDHARHGGLTEFGHQVVAEMNRLGMMIDLAHVAPSVMHQVLDRSAAPVIFSHSNALALTDHPRNVPDDVLERVAGNGGIVMANFVPAFASQETSDWFRPSAQTLASGISFGQAERHHHAKAGDGPPARLEHVADHIEYIARTAGIDHVGIGSDFFGERNPIGLEHVGRYPHLFAELIRRGWSEQHLEKLASGNFIRVFEAVERVAAELQQEHGPAIASLDPPG